MPAHAEDQSSSDADARSGDISGDIVVYGNAADRGIFAGVAAENELRSADISAYGANTVGDLLNALMGEVDSSVDGPVVLINGRQVAGLDDVADLPTEAISRIQVLPNRVAGLLGARPTRRVINVVVKDNHRQVTGNFELGFATAGGGRTYKGEVNLLRIKDGNRDSLVLRAQQADALFERERDILSDPLSVAYDRIGNILPIPGFAQIDPLLTTLAGQPVGIAGVPAGSGPLTLSVLLASANRANFTDVRPFRTLLPDRRTYSGNGNITRRFGETLLSLNGRAEWTQSNAQSGLGTALLNWPTGTPFSPFSRNVQIARYIGSPLSQETHTANLNFNGNLTTPVGKWRLQVLAIYSHRVSTTDSVNAFDTTALQTAVNAGSVNPIGELPASLIIPSQGSSHSQEDNTLLRVTMAGPLLSLPAGPVRAAISGRAQFDRLDGTSNFLTIPTASGYKRDEFGLEVNVQVPVLGDRSPIRNLEFDFNGAVRRVGQVGTLADFGSGFQWRPFPALSLRGALNIERQVPSAQILGSPVVVAENYRTFDFFTGQTVLVRYLTGGNSNLPTGKLRTLTLSATLIPVPSANLNLTVDYTSKRGTDIQATLPPVTAAIQAAFPDRFVRNSAGVLTIVDSRAVTFASNNSQQLHWRIDYHGSIGGRQAGAKSDSSNEPFERALSPKNSFRVNFSLDHYVTLQSTRQARPGLSAIDLLSGGAVGYGGGIPRHTIRLDANIASRGLGLQFNGSWQSATKINFGAVPAASDLSYSPRTLIDARIFADLGTLFARRGLLKGARVTATVTNVLDSQQRVTDASGATPRQFQPYLIDPMGRAITLGFRMAF